MNSPHCNIRLHANTEEQLKGNRSEAKIWKMEKYAERKLWISTKSGEDKEKWKKCFSGGMTFCLWCLQAFVLPYQRLPAPVFPPSVLKWQLPSTSQIHMHMQAQRYAHYSSIVVGEPPNGPTHLSADKDTLVHARPHTQFQMQTHIAHTCHFIGSLEHTHTQTQIDSQSPASAATHDWWQCSTENGWARVAVIQ